MANKTIQVDTNLLKGDVNTIQDEIRSINQGANQLENALRQLETMWDGNAKAAFSSAVQDDLRRLRELVKAIQNLTVKTGDARSAYDTCENAVEQIIASIRV